MWTIMGSMQAFYAIDSNFYWNIQMIYQKHFLGSETICLVLTFLLHPEPSDEFLAVVKMLFQHLLRSLQMWWHCLESFDFPPL